MSHSLLMFFLILIATVINVPLGCWRKGYAKFTFGWFFYTHMSIPVIIYLRAKLDLGVEAIFPTIVCAILGQFIGGFVANSRRTQPWSTNQQ